MKNLFTLFAFLFSFYFAFGQYCGAPGHNSSAHLSINPNFGDYADRHCFVNDFVYPDSEAYTCASHTPAGSNEPISYAADQLVVQINEVFVNDVSEELLPKGEFGFGNVDNLNESHGVLKIERLPSEGDDFFLITFAHVKAIDQTINAYKNLTHPDKVNGNLYPVFTENVYAREIDLDYPQRSASTSVASQYENFTLAKEPTANVFTESANIPQGFLKIPNDPDISFQWHLSSSEGYYDLDMLRAWSLLGDFGEAKDIAIVDTRFYPLYPDFDESIGDRLEDNVFGGKIIYPGLYDGLYKFYRSQFAHGMSVAVVASATTNNGRNSAGVSQSDLYLYDASTYIDAYCDAQRNDVEQKIAFTSRGLYEMIARLDALLDPDGDDTYSNTEMKVLNMSFKFPEGSTLKPDSDTERIFQNKDLLKVLSAGNIQNNLDNRNTAGPIYEASLGEESFMVVGGSNPYGKIWTGNVSGSNYGTGVSVFAPSEGIRTLNTYGVDGAPLFTYSNGTSFAAPQVSALAAILFELLDNGTEDYVAYDVRKIIETTASKKSFSETKKNRYAETNITEYRDVRDDHIARGLVSAHQAVLLTKAKYLGTNIKIPDTSDGLIKTMDYDQLMFSNNKKYAFGINRDVLASYRLEHDEGDGIHTYNHGAMWETVAPEPSVLAKGTKEFYAKQLILNNENFYLENFDGEKLWEALIPIPSVRRLMELDDISMCTEDCVVEAQFEYNTLMETEFVVGDIELPARHNEWVESGELLVAQWFSIAGNDEVTIPGIPIGNKFKKGNLIVSRRFKRIDGTTKSYISWDSRNGVRDIVAQVHRHLLEDYIYKEKSNITKGNPLTDNEYIPSPDGMRRLLHHKGKLVIMEINDNSTPSMTDDDRWQGMKVLANFQNSHSAYRLLIRENGYLEFVGGTEDENGEHFQEEQVLKTFGATECPSINFPSYSNLELKWTNDSRFLSYSSGVTTPLLINATDKLNNLETGKNLIPFYRTPNPNANETNSIVSVDESKLSVMDDQSIKVYQGQNGVFCKDTPIQTYNLAE